jgi:hypothetical protein
LRCKISQKQNLQLKNQPSKRSWFLFFDNRIISGPADSGKGGEVMKDPQKDLILKSVAKMMGDEPIDHRSKVTIETWLRTALIGFDFSKGGNLIVPDHISHMRCGCSRRLVNKPFIIELSVTARGWVHKSDKCRSKGTIVTSSDLS